MRHPVYFYIFYFLFIRCSYKTDQVWKSMYNPNNKKIPGVPKTEAISFSRV